MAFALNDSQLHPRTTPNVLLNGGAGGPLWKYSVEEVAAAALNEPGYTLAFGAFMDADSGLWHIVNTHDTFSARDLRRTTLGPTRQHFAVAPDERPPKGFPVPPSGRSGLRWDAGKDGRMELIINYQLGPSKVYTLNQPTDRCIGRRTHVTGVQRVYANPCVAPNRAG